jgi:hypothetical protein
VSEKLLSEDELTALAVGMGKAAPFTKDQFVAVVKWAETVRVDALFLDLILKGKAGATWDDKDGITLHKGDFR